MKAIDQQKASTATVLSLAQLLEQQPPTPPPSLVEPGLLPPLRRRKKSDPGLGSYSAWVTHQTGALRHHDP
jgi:hypothetical protein